MRSAARARLAVLAAVLGTATVVQPLSATAEAANGTHDVVTWAAAADRVGDGVADRGYRLVVHTSVGGDTRAQAREVAWLQASETRCGIPATKAGGREV
ncbi:hypothetical protein AB0885_41835, partial [Streptomyces sp. NPDC005534]